MSRHYLLFLNGPVTGSLVERIRRLDPEEPFLHAVMPSLGEFARTREALKVATDTLRNEGFEVHADYGTVSAMREQGWPFEGLVLAATPGSAEAWVDLTTDEVVDRDFPLLGVA